MDSQHEMVSVSASKRCPVCEKPDWCLIAPDGSASICSRTEGAKCCGDAGWLHRLKDPEPRATTEGKFSKTGKAAETRQLAHGSRAIRRKSSGPIGKPNSARRKAWLARSCARSDTASRHPQLHARHGRGVHNPRDGRGRQRQHHRDRDSDGSGWQGGRHEIRGRRKYLSAALTILR